MGKINNVIIIPSSTKKDFFRYWYSFLKPFHKLTDKEIEVIAALTKERYELSKVIKDQDILDKVLMGSDVRAKIKAECKMSQAHFQIILTKLKKNKVIIGNSINPKYIPRISEGENSCTLLLSFEWNGEEGNSG